MENNCKYEEPLVEVILVEDIVTASPGVDGDEVYISLDGSF